MGICCRTTLTKFFTSGVAAASSQISFREKTGMGGSKGKREHECRITLSSA